MTLIKNKFLNQLLEKETHQHQNKKELRKKIKDIISTFKLSNVNDYSYILNKIINIIKKKKRKEKRKIITGGRNSFVVTEDKTIKYIVTNRTKAISTKNEKNYKLLSSCKICKNNLKNEDEVVPKLLKIKQTSINPLTNSEDNVGCLILLKNQVTSEKKEKNPMVLKQSQKPQKDNLIACLSHDTIIKLIEKLKRDIRHSIRQIELLTDQKVSIGSEKWSASRVCSAKLSEIRMQEDLWAMYVRGFTEGYKSAEMKSNLNSWQTEQQLDTEINVPLATNRCFSTYKRCKSTKLMANHQQPQHNPRNSMVTRQKSQLDLSTTLPVSSFGRPEVPCDEVDEKVSTACLNPNVMTEPIEFMILEPDVNFYLDTQMTNYSSLQLNENDASEALSDNGAVAAAGAGDSARTAGGGGPETRSGRRRGVSTPRRLAARSDERSGRRRRVSTPRRLAVRSDERPHACDNCGSAFKRRYHLDRHLRAVHAASRPHACNACRGTFELAADLAAHCSARHGRTLFVCDVCDRTYAHRRTLTSHRRDRHGGNRPYGCGLCDRSFPTGWSRARHASRAH